MLDTPRLHALLHDIVQPKGVSDNWIAHELAALANERDEFIEMVIEIAKRTDEASLHAHDDGSIHSGLKGMAFINAETMEESLPPIQTSVGLGLAILVAVSEKNETAARSLLDDVQGFDRFASLVSFLIHMHLEIASTIHDDERSDHDAV
jgi:hypothetical protein